MSESPNLHLSDHLANERTFLAWVRTAIGIMGLGFVLVKFSLFIREFSMTFHMPTQPNGNKGLSPAFGLAMVILGWLVVLFGFIRYRSIERQINQQQIKQGHLAIIVVSILLLLLGLLLVVYLFTTI
jgi:putative membrane protein